MRVTMETRLYRAEVPMAEIVEMGEWEDEAMARTYIRTLKPLAGARRNMSDVVARQQVRGGCCGTDGGGAAGKCSGP